MLEKIRNNKKLMIIISILVLVALTGIAALYNYLLHTNFWPDPEAVLWQENFFLKDYTGQEIAAPKNISDFIAHMAYYILGFSVRSLRVQFVAEYALEFFFTAIVCLYSFKSGRIRYYIIPMFLLLATIINPGSSVYCGFHETGYHVYPYDMHPETTIWATFGLFMLYLYENFKNTKARKVIMAVIAVMAVIGYKFCDMLFVIAFTAPIALYIIIYLWHKDKKIILKAVGVIFAALVLIRLVGFVYSPVGELFEKQSLGYGSWNSGNVYGDAGWGDLTTIIQNFEVTIIELMALFNVDMIKDSMLSLRNVMYLVRIIIIIAMLVIAVKQIVAFIRKKNVELIDFVMSAGLVLNILFITCSHYGGMVKCIRYMPVNLFFGTAIICRELYRNSEDKVLRIKLPDSKKVIAGFCLACVIINMEPAWTRDSYIAPYETQMELVMECIQDNNLGNGVAAYWVAPALTSGMQGENIVLAMNLVTIKDEVELANKYDIELHYIVQNEDNDYYRVTVENQSFLDNADEVYEVGEFTIYYYNDPLPVKSFD